MKKIVFFFLFTLAANAQRKLPYPIILIHGWTGSNYTWTQFSNYLVNNAGLSVEWNALRFNLNCDGSVSQSYLYNDVCDYTTRSYLGDKDIYIVNFAEGNLSNQSAAVKQGYALKFAIQHVLAVTGAEKVILLGHSMGGLAAREYLQNISNWQADGQHHVAKLVTIGTPHGGSNLTGLGLGYAFTGKAELSEAVRDLRYYNGIFQGTYLDGGYEKSLSSLTTHNRDVNCNGYVGDYITGLNQKSIPTNLEYACIIGSGSFGDDSVVDTKRQNINNNYNGLGAKIFYFDCVPYAPYTCHGKEPEDAKIEMMQGLDEASQSKVFANRQYTGFFTKQSDDTTTDTDQYIFDIYQRGTITISANSYANATLNICCSQQEAINLPAGAVTNKTFLVSAGTNYLTFSGNSGSGWNSYNFILSAYCPLPANPFITATAGTTICDGKNTILSATAGYDSYTWYKGGKIIGTFNNPNYTVTQIGTYSVQGQKCGIVSNGTNTINVTFEQYTKPTIKLQEEPSRYLLSSTFLQNNQWFFEGKTIATNEAKQPTYQPLQQGTYALQVIQNGCKTLSDNIIIQEKKPKITTALTTACDGDSIKLLAPTNFSAYRWFNGKDSVSTTKNELIVKKTGKYVLLTFRGAFRSPVSDSTQIVFKPLPQKPSIKTEILPDKYVLTSSSTAGNQLFYNGVIITNAKEQNYQPLKEGIYTVQVNVEGCTNLSDKSQISIEKPVIQLRGSNPICQGDSTFLLAPPNFGLYKWIVSKDTITTTKNEISVKGTSKCNLITIRGVFKSLLSDTLKISVTPKPPKPTVSLENEGLKSSSAENNQWLLDGTPIMNETAQILKSLQTGNYAVKVTISGCYALSDTFIVTGKENAVNQNLVIYPNPNNGFFTIKSPFIGTVILKIVDFSGGLHHLEEIEFNQISRDIRLQNIQKGVYILQIKSKEKTASTKILIE